LAAYLAKYIRRFLEVRIYPKTKLDPGIQHATSRVFGYIIIALGIYIGLETVGIDLSALTIFAGVVGIGVGFGLQNIANNFISGLIILVERPIKKGDFIEIGNVLGTVTEIRARSTIIRTRDNIDMIVPNSDFLSQIVVNWSHGNPITRLHVPIGVAYGSDTQRVKEVLSQIAANHHNVLRIPEPKVWFKGFGESSLDFELLAWTDKPDQIFTLKSDLNFAIDSAFRENHITIPFPQRDLHLRTSIPLETITSSPGNLLEKICDEPRT
jgi:potassium-dependent mechanosensitive channel